MKNDNRTKKPDQRSCASCANCRSTLGENARLYCSLRGQSNSLPSHICTFYLGSFVDAFSVPSKYWKK